jgi:hypothetical protein
MTCVRCNLIAAGLDDSVCRLPVKEDVNIVDGTGGSVDSRQ